MIAPPRDEAELLRRAQKLAGRTLAEIAAALGIALDGPSLRAKGKIGTLLESALGATGGSSATHDFPHLSVELKTIPLGENGRPRETTYVCTLPLGQADALEWPTSWVKKKLARVLFIPLASRGEAWFERTIGPGILWQPTPDQDALLRADFEEIVGAIGAGGIESVDARMGKALQLRPKAANGSARTRAFGPGGEPLTTVPRGFYLRTSFTATLLDPSATHGARAIADTKPTS